MGKAKKRYEKALKLLIKSNKENPNQADTLNYLGFATRKLGNYVKGEKYYFLGLKIEPNHKGINEYLGELYVFTDRIDLAKERLSVLKNCNCEEYKELKEIILKKEKPNLIFGFGGYVSFPISFMPFTAASPSLP